MLLSTMTAMSQINKKGTIVRVDKCEFLDEGGYKVISSHQPHETFATITDQKFIRRSRTLSAVFSLGDKQITVLDGDTIYNYYTVINKDLHVLAVRNCEGYIVVAIFPMDGNTKFTQYIIKPRTSERINNK